MKTPDMTKPKHWLYLFSIILVEAALALCFFMAGPPLSYIGLGLILLANIKIIIGIVIGGTNVGKNKK